MKKITIFSNMFLLLISVTLFLGCEEKDISKEVKDNGVVIQEIEDEPKIDIPDVEIIEDSSKIRIQDNKVYIDSTLVNNSDVILKQIVITVDFRDENKNIVNSVEYSFDIELNGQSQENISMEIPSGQLYYDFKVEIKEYNF